MNRTDSEKLSVCKHKASVLQAVSFFFLVFTIILHSGDKKITLTLYDVSTGKT